MPKLSRRKFIKRTILASVGLVIFDAFWFEKNVIDWNYFDISKSQNNKIKTIQISDLHFGSLRSVHKSIAEKINNINPDLIFFTGDAVNSTGELSALNSFLKLINKDIVKFAIMGNWEYAGKVDLEQLKSIYSENNCELLINENRNITLKNRDINIIGIDDLVDGRPNFLKSVENLKPSKTNIVLNHCPQYRDTIANQQGDLKIDLVLCGHTHGGQVTFLGYVPFTPIGSGKYVRGWYTDTKPKMYVSKGIGTSFYPIRFGARAEMVEIDL
ncbi:metallophosphoesterase [Psychroserpens sp. Hel_I_66]|uniref:metallophosphoesterase n=1 Tax=Psychroserpens sp. Hel_I_66 TaxID=1250004 RepID=UPI00064833B9|nr:metallophosphoesterase [Psychroserpens sp. Hel_I_66]